jgi:hypothetical protein
MWKALFLAAAFAVSVSPADARQPPPKSDRVEDRRGDARRQSGELARDVERISKEIYPPRGERRPQR